MEVSRSSFPYFRYESRNQQVEAILELYRNGRLRFSPADKAVERRFAIRQILRCQLGREAERQTSELAVACADAYILAFGEKTGKGEGATFACPAWVPADNRKPSSPA